MEGDRMPYRRLQEEKFVHIAPPELVVRQVAAWQGLRADVVTARQREPFRLRSQHHYHLLVAAEHSERDDGATSADGMPKPSLPSVSGTLTFIPADHEFYGWRHPSVPARVNYRYIDRGGRPLDVASEFAPINFHPRLFLFDPELLRSAVKLKDEAMNGGARLRRYGKMLGVLLGYEPIRLDNEPARPCALARGGLSGWQQKRVAAFIEDHLAEEVRLPALAGLVDLSRYHFARAFKQSFGVPPHRYHVGRRIERAKTLLAEPSSSVTRVGLAVGFAETSSFSAAFRKTTGCPPSEYRRGR
jgi:AraC family transcriptional regulator